MSSYTEEIHVFSSHGKVYAHGRALITLSLFIMKCLTLAQTLRKAAFDIRYNPKGFLTSAIVQTSVKSSHFIKF